MSRRTRFWQSPRWRRVLQVDGGLAEAEGLAAGTGLLTGDLVRSASPSPSPCPECRGQGDVVVIDLVSSVTSRCCQACSHRWDTPSAVEAPANR
jgi:hypothetical protein